MLVAVLCSILGLLGLLSILGLIVCHTRLLRRAANHHRLLLHAPPPAKSNNQRQSSTHPAVTRFKNPLFDTVDKGGGTTSIVDTPSPTHTDLIEIDFDLEHDLGKSLSLLHKSELESYEKSPRRYAGSSKSSNITHPSSHTLPAYRAGVRKKNTNVEIERTREAVL